MMAASNDFEVSLRTVLSEDVGDEIPLREDDVDLVDVARRAGLRPSRPDVLARLEEDFAGVDVDDVGEEDGLLDRREVDLDRGFVALRQRSAIFWSSLMPAKTVRTVRRPRMEWRSFASS